MAPLCPARSDVDEFEYFIRPSLPTKPKVAPSKPIFKAASFGRYRNLYPRVAHEEADVRRPVASLIDPLTSDEDISALRYSLRVEIFEMERILRECVPASSMDFMRLSPNAVSRMGDRWDSVEELLPEVFSFGPNIQLYFLRQKKLLYKYYSTNGPEVVLLVASWATFVALLKEIETSLKQNDTIRSETKSS
mmetsp:Transcript_17918/g.29425  ORF Transcript_17918/g.29425 Transcript_17918/m.29425 type:complete len:192 (-) Transcript_17918:1244-1819(-)|eukprot:CAMPEP_0184666242 /NCGR_PEP_ID=MMETSP0308-20130426/60553_1 /TAXON_ID=38269 /ORGANISM="Gloeochaete witrockiana, Strain SAG 46.84" /LENGTH=191 /DNA_ID=CAMNT_0027110707 /DNA_START=125 /DNA_END=700 /DNA_ORIENTATION=-